VLPSHPKEDVSRPFRSPKPVPPLGDADPDEVPLCAWTTGVYAGRDQVKHSIF